MKLNETNVNRAGAKTGTNFKGSCLAACQKVLARITAAREAIFAESRSALKTQEHLLQLALNEAEATAWQTMFPHLVFPTLAMEKVQAVKEWDARQKSVLRRTPVFDLAA